MALSFDFFIFIQMKPSASIIFLLLAILPALSQVRFKTVVPQRPLAPGEPFQVQYVLENANDISSFSAPQFEGFRLVSGPNLYSGDRSSFRRNLVFTLAAVSEGRFKIYGASCLADGKMIKSNDAFVRVVSREEVGESPYFLRFGEDPFKKINENLFLKLKVDKQTCFIGEPLVATFKLYSRLQSRSNVIKNPGFYGFSVYDMVDVNDQMLSEEKLNGYWFEVHTIRKVQLYPLQAGSFTIDPMEVANEVEFSKSIVNKNTEQEITEKMYGDDEGRHQNDAKAEVYKVNLKTDPVVIKVRSLPRQNAADTFAGAVGNFSVSAFVEKDSVAQNEESYLTIKIIGSGNFQRVNAPVVRWPPGVEGFEPAVTDTLNAHLVPLTGQRSFKYPFLSDQAGRFMIPAVSFSYFSLKTQSYKTVSTRPISVHVGPATRKDDRPTITTVVSNSRSNVARWVIIGFVLALFVGFLFAISHGLTRRKGATTSGTTIDPADFAISVEEILKPAYLLVDAEDKTFYAALNSCIWNYVNQKFQLSGSQMNKDIVRKVLLDKGVEAGMVDDLVEVVQQSQRGIYTNAQLNLDKNEILQKARRILEIINQTCS